MKKLTITDLRSMYDQLIIAENNLRKSNLNESKVFFNIRNEIADKLNLNFNLENIMEIKNVLQDKIEEIKNSDDYWNMDIYRKNSEHNIRSIDYTINDLDLNLKKVMICGRGVDTHKDFFPRFSTPTTNIDSNLYVTVDHDPAYAEFITRKGDYALCIITDPQISEKISKIGGKIYWFSPDFLDYKIPRLSIGKNPRGNSGLASISLAAFLGAKFILLSGIKLTDKYTQFREGQKLVFEKVIQQGCKILSLDGILADKITFDDWCMI